MKRLIGLLAPVGVVAVVVGVLAHFKWGVAGQTVPGQAAIYLVVGGALVLAHVLLRWEAIVRAVGGRQLRHGTNMVVLIAVVLGLLGGINYVAARRIVRWDLTENQRYSLSDQTRKVVQGLTEDVKITYFQRTGRPDLVEGADRLKSYQALSDHLKVDYVDPYRSPGVTRSMGERGPWPVLILEKEGRRERITNDSEEDITNALVKVTRSGQRTVCFVEGEGERDIDGSDETGLSQARAALENGLYQTRKVTLLAEKSVPEECTIVAVAGPQNDLLPPVVDAIRSFVSEGGKALVLADSSLDEPLPGLRGLLGAWNVEAGQDVVVDNSGVGSLFGTGPFTPIAVRYPQHEITKDLNGIATAFHMARSVKAGSDAPEGVSVQSLLETAPQSWAETDLALKDPIAFDEGKDERGPISIGVAATVAATSSVPTLEAGDDGESDDEPAAKREGRVVVIGDADFASNQLLGFQGNKDFFLNSVAWLSQDVDLISIRPKQPEDQRMFLSRSQRVNVTLLALIFLPGVWIALGILVWWRRR